MFSPIVRIVLIVVTVVLGGMMLSSGNVAGWGFLACGALFLFGYFRYGSVYAAITALNRQDFRHARSLVDSVFFPRLLARRHFANYHMASGWLAMIDDEFDAAIEHLTHAREAGLGTNNNECIALLFLAAAHKQTGCQQQADELLLAAKEIPHGSALGPLFRQIHDLVTGETADEVSDPDSENDSNEDSDRGPGN